MGTIWSICIQRLKPGNHLCTGYKNENIDYGYKAPIGVIRLSKNPCIEQSEINLTQRMSPQLPHKHVEFAVETSVCFQPGHGGCVPHVLWRFRLLLFLYNSYHMVVQALS